MIRWLALVSMAVFLVWCADARAAPGDLDPSFSTDGVVALPGSGSFVARAVAVDGRSRILVAGSFCAPDPAVGDATCLESGDSSFRLTRLTPDGGLDPEFGRDGFVTTDVGEGRSQAQDALVLEDGSTVVGGVATSGGRDVFALVRYTPDGALDPGFGQNGVVLQPIGIDYALLSDLARGPGGTIVAAGQALDTAGGARTAVARFTPAGALDQGFGTGGFTLGGAGPYGFGLAVDAWPDGGTIAGGIAGASADQATYRFGELRLDPNGAPTAAFGVSGAAAQQVGSTSSFANAIVALPGGGWAAAGPATVQDGNRGVMAITRGTAAGTLDPGFGERGVAIVGTAGNAVANDLVVQFNGRPVAIGQAELQGAYVFTLARLLADGRPDPTFGRGGIAAVPFDRYRVARATAGAFQPDGRLVTVGIGCGNGGTGVRCQGGSAVLLVARQFVSAPPPVAPPAAPDTAAPRIGAAAPHRLGRARLRRRGMRLRVRLTEVARLDVRLIGRRPGGRKRVTLDRARARDPRGRFRVRLRARARPGRARLVIRATDAAGNTRVKRVAVRVVR